MAKRLKLSFTRLEALGNKAAATGKHYDVWDSVTPGLGVRVSDQARRTFFLAGRFPGHKHYTRRALGTYPALTLEKARAKAKAWLGLLEDGKDPADVELELRAAEERNREKTFGSVMEEYLKRHVKGQRKAQDVTREIRGELLSRWSDRPISDIGRRDIIGMVNEIKDRGALYQAKNILGHARTFYGWAIEQGHVETSPCAAIKPKRLIGKTPPRERVLDDAEVAAFWRAAGRLDQPVGPYLRLLLLTGLRKSELSDARWREFHPDLVRLIREHQKRKQPIEWQTVPSEIKIITIPPARFKSEAAHLAPLSNDALAIIATLPHYKKGDCVFSTTLGAKPINGFSKAKARLDHRMLRALRATARKRGEDTKAVRLPEFVIHDLRRVVRTGLASLRVADPIAEMVLGHGRKGIQRVYDQHKYLPEMREALESWARRVRDLTQPPEPSNNVVRLQRPGAV